MRRQRVGRCWNDVSITLSGGASDRTVAGPSDDTLWTHLSGFFRLFAILSAMPEADFARPKLAEMMLFWADLWDSPRGSRALKTKAAVEFFNDNFELLGQGDKFNRAFNGKFFAEFLNSANLPPCAACSGYGDCAPKPVITNGAKGGGGPVHAGQKRGSVRVWPDLQVQARSLPQLWR